MNKNNWKQRKIEWILHMHSNLLLYFLKSRYNTSIWTQHDRVGFEALVLATWKRGCCFRLSFWRHCFQGQRGEESCKVGRQSSAWRLSKSKIASAICDHQTEQTSSQWKYVLIDCSSVESFTKKSSGEAIGKWHIHDRMITCCLKFSRLSKFTSRNLAVWTSLKKERCT